MCGMRLGTGEYFGTTDRQLELCGIRFSATRYEPLQNQPWHTHEHATLFVHLCGEQIDERSDAAWALPALGLTFHPNCTPHRSRVGPRGASGVNLEVSETWLAAHGMSSRELGEHRILDGESVRTAAVRLIRLYLPNFSAAPELEHLALELLEPVVEASFPTESAPPRWLKDAQARIRQEHHLPIGLAGVARDSGVHPVHLARVFRQFHGCSVTEYIQRLRIQDAVDRILAGDAIGSAAVEAGFADQSHFSRTLKSQFGYRPSLVKQLAAS